jgi:transposase
MSDWAPPPESREQLVLFPTRLDDVLPPEHPVRRLEEILSRLDWSAWEAGYVLTRGQPPIHPRVLAGVLLYGLLTRLRSSRALEDALTVRLDFRWLAEGRTIDHTTLSKFRRQHPQALRSLFIQIGLVARQLSLLGLEQLAFDGTRLRANSRRSGTRTPAELRAWREELGAKFLELEARVAAADAQDEAERLASGPVPPPEELADVTRRLATIDAALAELDRLEEAGETAPSRLPLTDPQSRVSPNKEGGFAPNYTPLATVDVGSGLIVGCDVIAGTNEEPQLVPQLDQVQQDFDLAQSVPEVLADGMMATGANLARLESRGITLYSPPKGVAAGPNPAVRADPSQPVPEPAWAALPCQTVKVPSGEPTTQLTKEAFVYAPDRDGYWCPQGRLLPLATTSTVQFASGRQQRRKYKSDAAVCGACPLRSRCLKPGAQRREISRYEHDHLVAALAERMATPEGQAKYARRRHAAERPFAHIKQQFGARRFLLRGLAQVQQEWRWLTSAFNLSRLLSLLGQVHGPPRPPPGRPVPSLAASE